MESKNRLCARKATWLAFGLIALAASISSAQDQAPQEPFSETTYVSPASANYEGVMLSRIFGLLGSW
jgi:SEL1 protein